MPVQKVSIKYYFYQRQLLVNELLSLVIEPSRIKHIIPDCESKIEIILLSHGT